MVRSADGTCIGFTSMGSGSGIIIVGGSLADSKAYEPLAKRLATAFTVHVMDRRGRGASGPLGASYSMDCEVADLLAVQAATGATAVFGHSFGGLVCLEAAIGSQVFDRITVYEPGVSIAGSIPTGWMPRYRALLAAGDRRAAFACMVRRAGFAPAILRFLPLWYSRLILRVVVRGRQWQAIELLLTANLAEHELVASLPNAPDRYAEIEASVIVLVGGKSPSFAGQNLLDALTATIPGSTGCVLAGLGHLAPTADAPDQLARELIAHLH
jgi:pimeloyl-ACP methyl ester carboxylesterase